MQFIIYGPHGEPEFQSTPSDAIPIGIMGFSDIQITDNYIYTVFHGKTFKESDYNKIIKELGKKTEDGGYYIYVFDLAGNLVRKYILDHAIYGIYVNEDTGTILATDVNNDEPILQFKI